MTDRRIPRILWIALLVAGSFLAVGRNRAETFDLIIWPHCLPGTFCGFASEQALIDRAKAAVHEMNIEWEAAGYSFRPTVKPIDQTTAEYYWTTSCIDDLSYCDDLSTVCNASNPCPGGSSCATRDTCNDISTECSSNAECQALGLGDCLPINKQRKLKWRAEVAVGFPNAISLMVTGTLGTCCSNVASASKPDSELPGIWCAALGGTLKVGTVWSHEMGHHWCLSHTFSKLDFGDSAPAEPNHDGDAPGVNDTAADPAPIEASDRDAGQCLDGDPCDSDADCGMFNTPCNRNILLEDKEYCSHLPLPDVDDDSPRAKICSSTCTRCDGPGSCGGMSPGSFSILNQYDPDEHGAMTYYGTNCRGPIVKNGVRLESLSSSTVDRIHQCRADVAVLAALPDVCEFDGADWDNDGICGQQDNCGLVKNTNQQNSDGDEDGDVCDLCPNDAVVTGDLDGDGIGDFCDPDIDDDGCSNREDQHPTQKDQVVFTTQYIGCSNDGFNETFPESEDFDGDGVADCRDLDDDDDGICDEGGPLDPSEAGGIIDGCEPGPEGHDPCPLWDGLGPCLILDAGQPCPPIFTTCADGGCEEFYLKIYELINPAEQLIVEQFQVANTTIFASPPLGMVASELATAIQGGGIFAGGAGARGATQQLRIEMWSREPDQLFAVIADYDPLDVELGEIRYGPQVAITPIGDSGDRLTVDTRYAEGAPAGPPRADIDGDGRPDWADNCRFAPNFRQVDADDDGYGNACDADLDNDLTVTPADLAEVRDCDGADLSVDLLISEPDEPDPTWDMDGFQQDPPDPVQLALAERCAVADLNDDGVVDILDLQIADGQLGGMPGPSSSVNHRPVAIPGTDQQEDCSIPVDLSGCGSFDPDGDSLSYLWTSNSCVFDDPSSCSVVATCNAGSNDATLIVNDGTADSTPSSIQVDVTNCISAGKIPTTMRMDKATLPDVLVLSWEQSCLEDEYGVYEGQLGNWSSHAQVSCADQDLSPLSETIRAQPGNRYFLITTHNRTETPPGFDSSGQTRPQAAPGQRCVTVQAAAVCQ